MQTATSVLNSQTPIALPPSAKSYDSDIPARLRMIHNGIAREGIQRGRTDMVSQQGKPLGWLIDMRRVFLRPNQLEAIAEEFWVRFEPSLPFQVGAMEMAAVPLLIAVLQVGAKKGLDLNGFIIRKERKPTGLCQAIEGQLTEDPIVLLDDVLNSGDSLEKARSVLQREARLPTSAFVVIDYRSTAGLEWRKRADIVVQSLFTLSDFGLQLKSRTTSPRQSFKLRWRSTASGAFPFHVVPKSAPIIVDDLVCVGTDAAVYRAMSLETGEERWRFHAKGAHRKGIWSTAAVQAEHLFFGAYNGNVYCLDVRTGAQVWKNPACEWVGSSPLVLPHHECIVIGLEYERPAAQGSVAALSLTSGEKVWEYPLRRYQHGSPVYWEPGDLVISGTNDHTILALSASTGEPAWTFSTVRSVKAAPRIDNQRGLVIAASFDGMIYILEAATGGLVASFKTDDVCYTTPLVTHGRIFCGSGDRHMYVIDLDHMRMIRKIDCAARVYSSPRLIAGRVAFGTNGGVYREIDPLSLETLGRLQLPDAITNAVAANSDGRCVVIPTYMNELYCYDRT